jgi:N-methylhydantoinase B/oxoprolinase/acetone carboxylase alpha subunit
VTLRSGRPIGRRAANRAAWRRAVCLALPGGGLAIHARDPQRALDDVLDGMITAEEARRDYGVVRSRNSTWPRLSA